MSSRLKDMEFSVREALSGKWRSLIVPEEALLLVEYGTDEILFSSSFVLTAAMGQVERALPKSLRETARGGLAVTPTAKTLMQQRSQ